MNNHNSNPFELLELSEEAHSWLKSKRIRSIEALVSLMRTSTENHDLIVDKLGLDQAHMEPLNSKLSGSSPTPKSVLTTEEKLRIKKQFPMGVEPEDTEIDLEGGNDENNP